MATGTGPVILIVDDSEDVRSLLAILLIRLGYRVLEALDGLVVRHTCIDECGRSVGPAGCGALRARGAHEGVGDDRVAGVIRVEIAFRDVGQGRTLPDEARVHIRDHGTFLGSHAGDDVIQTPGGLRSAAVDRSVGTQQQLVEQRLQRSRGTTL